MNNPQPEWTRTQKILILLLQLLIVVVCVLAYVVLPIGF